jgi:hypothetical protein
MKQSKIIPKMNLVIGGIFFTLITLYGGYKLQRMVLAILELPVIALIFVLRWREVIKENPK